jgi:ABC-type nitrate/sulfonate/bicarbonate transport system substrate-binding protein
MGRKPLHASLLLSAILVAATGLSACGAAKETSSGSTAGSSAPVSAQPADSAKPTNETALKPEVEELRYQGWTGSVLLPELAEDLGYLKPLKLKWIGNTISGPQDIQAAATGDVDIGGAFNGAVVKLVAGGAPVTPVIGYYGVDDKRWSGYYVLENSPIKTAKDFIGKKVGMNTLGAHSEIVLKNWLQKEGLTKEEIKQVTLLAIPPVNTEQSLRQGQIDVAVLGDMLRDKALERGGIRSVFSDYDLFGKFTAGTYVLRKDFIKKNPNATRLFVEATAKAIEWTRTTPREEVIARYKKIIQQRGRNEDDSTIQYFQSTGVAAKGGVIQEKEFQIWIDWLEGEGQIPKGKVKPPEFYTNEFNPFKDEVLK